MSDEIELIKTAANESDFIDANVEVLTPDQFGELVEGREREEYGRLTQFNRHPDYMVYAEVIVFDSTQASRVGPIFYVSANNAVCELGILELEDVVFSGTKNRLWVNKWVVVGPKN